VSQIYSVGGNGSSDTAFRCQYCSNLMLLGRIVCLARDAFYCYRQSSVVCLCVCESDKNDEQIEMPFWVDICGPNEPSVSWGFSTPRRKGHFWVCPGLPAIDILNVIRKRTAAVRPLATVHVTCTVHLTLTTASSAKSDELIEGPFRVRGLVGAQLTMY